MFRISSYVGLIAFSASAGLLLIPTNVSAAIANYGLDNYNGGGSSLSLSDTSRRWGVRFTANENITVDQALTYLNSYTGSPDLRIALQADDGSGNPNGIDLGVASVTPTSTGFVTANFSTPVSLTSGTVYHFVQYLANGDGSNTVAIRETAPAHIGSHANTGLPESNYALTYSPDGGSNWSDYSDALAWGLVNSSAQTAVGQPYNNGLYGSIGNDTWRGQSFTFDQGPSDNKVNGLSLKIYKGAAPAADDLRAYLVDTTDNAPIWSGVLMNKNAAATSANGDVISVALPDVQLVNGRQYVIAVESTGSAYDSYEMYVNGSTAPSPLLETNFQSADGSAYVSASSLTFPTSFANTYGGTDGFDAYFTLSLVPEPTGLSFIVLGALGLVRRRRMRPTA
jgi:hypothetical protein